MNDPSKGGSFYLQSKVVRAKERFDMERAEELKAKAAQEAATNTALPGQGTTINVNDGPGNAKKGCCST